MAPRSGHISILQFDEHLISLLRIRPSARNVAPVALEMMRGEWRSEDGSLLKALRQFAKEHQIARDEVFSVLPRHDMTARILALPSQDARELQGMVQLSAGEYVPYPLDELIIDQCTLQKMADGQARVLAVFAHRDLVDRHVQLLQQAGLEPRKIFVSSACMASAAMAALGDTEKRYALLNLASGGLEVLILNGGRLEYGRGIATQQDWGVLSDPSSEEAAEAVEELAVELRASLSAYRRESEDGLGVERIYVSSEWFDVGELCGQLGQDLGYECLPASFVERLLEKKVFSAAAWPLGLVGAALAAQDRAAVAMDLVPESLVRARRFTETKQKALHGAALVAGLLLLLGILYGISVHQRTTYLAELSARIDSVRPVAMEVATKQRNLMELRRRLDRSGTALELLARASEAAPESGLNLNRFTYTRGKDVRICGRVLNRTIVTEFTDALREMGRSGIPQFTQAERGGDWKEQQEQAQTVYEYEIFCPFPEAESDKAGESDD